MPSFTGQSQKNHSVHWPAIVGALVVQIFVLLALGAAVVRYVEWSSDAAQAEFMSATKQSASDPNHPRELSTPIQPLKGRTGCDRKG
jgi:hypothetical protein